MKPLQYWIDTSECACDSTTPIGGCLRCDLVEFQKRYDVVVMALYAMKHSAEDGMGMSDSLEQANAALAGVLV